MTVIKELMFRLEADNKVGRPFNKAMEARYPHVPGEPRWTNSDSFYNVVAFHKNELKQSYEEILEHFLTINGLK